MPYITIKQQPYYHQISFEEMMAGIVDLSRVVHTNTANTQTYFTERVNHKLLDNTNIDCMIFLLQTFNQTHDGLFSKDRSSLYKTFHIPKSSGGLRRIDAPEPELMNALRELKMLLEENMFALYHTTAFAYIRGRCTVDAIKRHQQNESRWFLNLDFSNFFGSTTPNFVTSMLSMIFPFSEIVKAPAGKDQGKRLRNIKDFKQIILRERTALAFELITTSSRVNATPIPTRAKHGEAQP